MSNPESSHRHHPSLLLLFRSSSRIGPVPTGTASPQAAMLLAGVKFLFCSTSRYKVFATSGWQKMSEHLPLSLLVCRMCWYVQGHLHKRRRPVKHLTSSCSQNSVKVLVVRSSWNATSAESERDGIHKLYDSSRSESWPQLHHGVLPPRHCQRVDVFFIRRTHAVVS